MKTFDIDTDEKKGDQIGRPPIQGIPGEECKNACTLITQNDRDNRSVGAEVCIAYYTMVVGRD
ncbi:hypothetical protein [Pseudomonas sp. 8Z]|uniref:hypothetical protein n=1 Tax=Pseudomonas sp. 8Z TaxID=2653166 RepID=UPI00135A84A9|nr:hypothetical protein [Pseudomonas sp. 8Z]